jgi:hypothetical protein
VLHLKRIQVSIAPLGGRGLIETMVELAKRLDEQTVDRNDGKTTPFFDSSIFVFLHCPHRFEKPPVYAVMEDIYCCRPIKHSGVR